MNLFYQHSIQFENLNIGEEFELSPEEALHATKVLRLSMGDVIWITDGKGFKTQSQISEISKKKVVVKIISKELMSPKPSKLILAVAVTKNPSRFEWFLEKATEIGIDEIIPLICDHSEKRNLNWERTNRVITSAMKQSLKYYHPKLHEITSFDQCIQMNFEGEKFIAHLENESQISLKDTYTKFQNTLIVIGPEGDFSKDEITNSQANGFKCVQLGNSRLRTETAALVACFTINLTNQ